MTRRISVPLAADVTDTGCGSCDYASLMPWTEPTIYICTRPEFARRTPSGGYETAERPGRARLPECVQAEREHAETLEDAQRLGWGVVANAGRLSQHMKPRWSHVKDATGLGSTSARALCHAHNFDPDEDVGGSDEATSAAMVGPFVCSRCHRSVPGTFRSQADEERGDAGVCVDCHVHERVMEAVKARGLVERPSAEVVESLRAAVYATATDTNDDAKAALGWLDRIGGGS